MEEIYFLKFRIIFKSYNVNEYLENGSVPNFHALKNDGENASFLYKNGA